MANAFFSHTCTPFAAILNAASKFNQPRLRRHVLAVVTCYFRPAALHALVGKLKGTVKLVEVHIAYDYREDFGTSDIPDGLRRLRETFADIDFKVYRIKANGGLFHSKGYALLQLDGQSTKDLPIRQGYLLVSSGNLTPKGLGVNGSHNLELSYESRYKTDISAFCAQFDEICEGSTTDLKPDFRWQVLTEATYLCKWEGSLRQELSAVFRVDEDCANLVAQVNPGLVTLGFEIEQRSLTKCYFDLSTAPQPPLPKLFVKNYCARTIVGFWCPDTVWSIVQDEVRDRFAEFNEWLNKATRQEVFDRVKSSCRQDLEALERMGIKVSVDPTTALGQRTENLRSNDVKRRRLYCRLEEFSLPFNLEDDAAVDVVYESLRETAESRTHANVAVRKLSCAITKSDVSELRLSAKELDSLREFLGTPR